MSQAGPPPEPLGRFRPRPRLSVFMKASARQHYAPAAAFPQPSGTPIRADSLLGFACRFADAYPRIMKYDHLLTIVPGKRGGKPCMRGLRITVYDVLDYLAGGMTIPELLDDFPDL